MCHIIDINGNYKIEVSNHDLEGVYFWNKAKSIARDLGQGWRLPTAEEIKELYKNKEMLNFANYGFWAYWTSETQEDKVFSLFGPNGEIDVNAKEAEFYVRLVRDRL
jgi:hypothetical protein